MGGEKESGVGGGQEKPSRQKGRVLGENGTHVRSSEGTVVSSSTSDDVDM